MSKSLAIGFLGISLIIVGMVRAQATTGVSARVGVVDLEKTLSKTSVGRRAQKAFQTELKTRQRKLDAQMVRFKKQAAEFEKQKSILTRSAAMKKQRVLQAKYVELQKLYTKLEQQLAASRVKLIRKILKQAAPHIREIAKRRNLALILDKSGVLFARPDADITNELNKKMK
jgi:Skp family chaperone for outer membrane proteins